MTQIKKDTNHTILLCYTRCIYLFSILRIRREIVTNRRGGLQAKIKSLKRRVSGDWKKKKKRFSGSHEYVIWGYLSKQC